MKKGNVIFISALILFWVTVSPELEAATYNVSTVTEFQNALNACASNNQNDVINISAGTYAVSSTLVFYSTQSNSLTIVGAGSATTFLDGGDSVQVLSVETSEANANISISGLTLRNGSTAGNGGAVHVETVDSSITVSQCECNDSDVTGTDSIGGGAHIITESGTITVANCAFRRNSSSANVGGLYAGTYDGTISLSDSLFESNSVTNLGGSSYFGDGGGAMLYTDQNGDVVVTGTTFTGNSAAGGDNPDGGGLMVYQLNTGVTAFLENNVFSLNQAGLGGGGCFIRMNASGSVTFTNNTLSGNSSLIGSGGGVLIYIDDGALSCTDNTFSTNSSGEDGGGSWIQHATGTILCSGNTFTSNQAQNNGGGEALITDSADVTYRRNLFSDNSAVGSGGGLSYATGSGELLMSRTTFYGNSASDGGGVYCYFDQSNAQISFKDSILWNDQTNEIGYSFGSGSVPFTVTYSDIEDGTGETWFGTGCINEDPLFVNPGTGNFHLRWDTFPTTRAKSPCIDTGDPASDNELDGTRADMGALFFDQRPPVKVPALSTIGVLMIFAILSLVVYRSS